jgi:hypothetical protein
VKVADRTTYMQLRVTEKERREFQAAARAEDVPWSHWCRKLMKQAIEERKKRDGAR